MNNKKVYLIVLILSFFVIGIYLINSLNKTTININNKTYYEDNYLPIEQVFDEYEHIDDILVDNKWDISSSEYIKFDFNSGRIYKYNEKGTEIGRYAYTIEQTLGINNSTNEKIDLSILFKMTINNQPQDVYMTIVTDPNTKNLSYSFKCDFFSNSSIKMDNTTIKVEPSTIETETTDVSNDKNKKINSIYLIVIGVFGVVLLIALIFVLLKFASAANKY